MRALYFEDYGRMGLREVPDPAAEPGEVVVRVAACGICGSDLEGYRGSPGMARRRVPPLLLGHEFAGTVEQGPAELLGASVAVNPLVSCGRCRRCQAGHHQLCPDRSLIGLHRPGAFAERVAVPSEQLYPLPEGLPMWKGALAEPLAVALHAVRAAQPQSDTEALVLGGGAIGFLVAWSLQRAGARALLVEPVPGRQAFLRRLGAEVSDSAQGQWELVFDTVGSQESRRAALDRLAEGGRLVLLGLHDNATALDLYPVVLGERHLQGSFAYSREDFTTAVALLPTLPDEVAVCRPLEDGPAAFAELAAGQVVQPRVLLAP